MQKKLKILGLSVLIIITLFGCDNQSPVSKESSVNHTARVKHVKIMEDLKVKKGAGNSFDTISTIKNGEIVNVIGEIGDWYVIKMDNNTVGCIPGNNTSPVIKDKEKSNNTENINKSSSEMTEYLTTLEQRMVNLVNQEREKNNLSKFQIDRELTNIARIKSQDMIDNNYFSHYSPNYGSPFNMLNEFGVEYLQAGENLAANSSVARAHQALMKSSGHRKNILNPDYSHIGIGIKPDENSGYILVQLFLNK